MSWTNIAPGVPGLLPELMLEWAPTTQPTATTQTYVDITDRLRGFEWGYGRSDERGQFEPGSGYVILSNRDRALDPSNTGGSWYGNIKPRRMFRLRARWASVIYPIFVAYAAGMPQSYPAGGTDNLVKVQLTDMFSVLQTLDLIVGFNQPVERSDLRIAAVLDALRTPVPAGLRDLDEGTVVVGALAVDAAGTSGLAHAKSVAQDSERGPLFVSKDGKITFHNRHRRLNGASLHTFTDSASPAAGELPYRTELEPVWDDAYLANYINVTGSNDPAGIASDDSSDDDYFTIVRSVSSQLPEYEQRQLLADYELSRYAQPAWRLPSLPLNGAMAPTALWPAILDLEISDAITVKRFADAAVPMQLEQNVEEIRHTCKPGGPWLTTVGCSAADPNRYWKIGDATYGQIDQANIRIAA